MAANYPINCQQGCLHGSQGVARFLPMKKLLALSFALLSLNLYGGVPATGAIPGVRPAAINPYIGIPIPGVRVPGTPIPTSPSINPSTGTPILISKTGLEGWGKKEGVSIVVEEYRPEMGVGEVGILNIPLPGARPTFDRKAIKNQVELRLRLAGIKIAVPSTHRASHTQPSASTTPTTRPIDPSTGLPVGGVASPLQIYKDYLTLRMRPIIIKDKLTGYEISIIPKRTMTFKHNGREYIAPQRSTTVYGGLISPDWRRDIVKYLDEFHIDYLKANDNVPPIVSPNQTKLPVPNIPVPGGGRNKPPKHK